MDETNRKLNFLPDRKKFSSRFSTLYPHVRRADLKPGAIFGYLSHWHHEAIEMLRRYPVKTIDGRSPVTDIYSLELPDHVFDFGVEEQLEEYQEYLYGSKDSDVSDVGEIQANAVEVLLCVWRLRFILQAGQMLDVRNNYSEQIALEMMQLVFCAMRLDFKPAYEQKIISQIRHDERLRNQANENKKKSETAKTKARRLAVRFIGPKISLNDAVRRIQKRWGKDAPKRTTVITYVRDLFPHRTRSSPTS